MEVRFFRKDEREVLLKAISDLWSKNHVYVRKPEVLEHLVLNTPYRSEFAGEDNYSFMGMWDHENRVIGLYGLIPQKVNFLGKTYDASTATIWKIDSNVKANGLDFLRYYNERDIAFSVTTGLSWMSMTIYKSLGWYTFDDLPRWVGITKLKLTQSKLLPEGTDAAYLPVAKVLDKQNKYRVRHDKLDKDKWDNYYYSKFAKITISVKRDYEFLQWRYMSSPVLKYHFITVEDDAGIIHGLAVIRIEPILDNKFKIGRIVEFIAIEAEASIELANAVILFSDEVLMWDFYCLSDICSYGLERIGFQKIPQWMDKVIMPTRFQPIDYEHMKINGAVFINKKLRRKVNPTVQQLYITKGDADQDRAN